MGLGFSGLITENLGDFIQVEHMLNKADPIHLEQGSFTDASFQSITAASFLRNSSLSSFISSIENPTQRNFYFARRNGLGPLREMSEKISELLLEPEEDTDVDTSNKIIMIIAVVILGLGEISFLIVFFSIIKNYNKIQRLLNLLRRKQESNDQNNQTQKEQLRKNSKVFPQEKLPTDPKVPIEKENEAPNQPQDEETVRIKNDDKGVEAQDRDQRVKDQKEMSQSLNHNRMIIEGLIRLTIPIILFIAYFLLDYFLIGSKNSNSVKGTRSILRQVSNIVYLNTFTVEEISENSLTAVYDYPSKLLLNPT